MHSVLKIFKMVLISYLQPRLMRFRDINIQSSNLSTDEEADSQRARAVPRIPWDTQ